MPSSTSIHSTTIQRIWLKTQEGQKEFSLVGQTLPVHSGQRITVIWLANAVMAYVNHSSGSSLILRRNIEGLAGQRPISAFKSALILFVIVFGILAFVSGQEASPNKSEMHTFWTLLVIPLLLAFVILPVVGFCVGLTRNKKYRACLSSINDLVEKEVKLLLSQQNH